MRLATLQALNAARRDRHAAVLVVDTATGEERLVAEGDALADSLAEEIHRRLRSGRSGLLEDGRTFLAVHAPPPRLVVIGAVHISQALVPLAKLAGFDMTIVDPRTAFASPDRFPDVPLRAEWPEDALPQLRLDRYTAVAALSHDPRIDDVSLAAALAAGCFYVGALGSRRTHAGRRERLVALGVSDSDLGRIHAPIGLDIGAQSPAEIAIAIVAEVIATLRRRDPPLRLSQ